MTTVWTSCKKRAGIRKGRVSEMGRSGYEAPRPGRKHTIMSSEDREKGKPTVWDEIEIKGSVKNLSLCLFNYTHLRVLYMNDNQLQRIPVEIAKLQKLQVLDLSNNRLRGLPAELGDMPELRVLKMDSNQLRQLPYELGKLFQLEDLGLANNPLNPDLQQVYENGVPAFLQFMLDRLRSETCRDVVARQQVEESLYFDPGDETFGGWFDEHDLSRNVSSTNHTGPYTAAQYYQYLLATQKIAHHSQQVYGRVSQQAGSSVQPDGSTRPKRVDVSARGESQPRGARASSLPKERYQGGQTNWQQPLHMSTPHQVGTTYPQHWIQQQQKQQQQKQQQHKQQQYKQQLQQPVSNSGIQAAALAQQWQYGSTSTCYPQQTAHSLPQQTAHSLPQQTAHSLPQQTAHSLPQQTAHSLPQQTAHSLPQQQTNVAAAYIAPTHTIQDTQQTLTLPQTAPNYAHQATTASHQQLSSMARVQQQHHVLPQQWQQQQFQYAPAAGTYGAAGFTGAHGAEGQSNIGYVPDGYQMYQERTKK